MLVETGAPLIYDGPAVRIRSATVGDYRLLYEWRRDDGMHFMASDPSTAVYEEFAKWLTQLQKSNPVLIVYRKSDDRPIGYLMSYHVDLWNGWLYYAAYIAPGFRMTRHLADAIDFSAEFMFTRFPLRKIYVEVYEQAGRLRRHLHMLGYVQEGYTRDYSPGQVSKGGIATLAIYRERYRSSVPAAQSVALSATSA
jgi:RimJ/RimL family protein N-acetyltransferase